MSAPTDLREFNFYDRYIWSKTDFQDFQTWLMGTIRGSMFAAFGQAVLQGLGVSPGGGLNVQVAAGLAVNSDGRLLNLLNTATVAIASPVGNPAISLVVLRPVDTSMTNVPEPTNPANNVPLHVKKDCQVVVINGTPAASPSAPSINPGDVVLMGLLVPAATATILATMFDRSYIDTPTKGLIEMSVDKASRSVTIVDEIVEGDCSASGLTMTLPPASQAAGRKFSFVKVDSGVNTLTVAAQGGETISGQTSIEIDDQWGYANVYSNGIAYRQI